MRINECAIVLNRLSNYDVRKQSFVAWFSKDELYIKMSFTKFHCARQRKYCFKILHEAENRWKNKNWKKYNFFTWTFLIAVTHNISRLIHNLSNIYIYQRLMLYCTVEVKWRSPNRLTFFPYLFHMLYSFKFFTQNPALIKQHTHVRVRVVQNWMFMRTG